jgi:hypothetical protein
MDPTALEALAPTEHDQVVRWREHELERAGFELALARTLARRLDVDLHQAVDLLNRGCSPDLVARILL